MKFFPCKNELKLTNERKVAEKLHAELRKHERSCKSKFVHRQAAGMCQRFLVSSADKFKLFPCHG